MMNQPSRRAMGKAVLLAVLAAFATRAEEVEVVEDSFQGRNKPAEQSRSTPAPAAEPTAPSGDDAPADRNAPDALKRDPKAAKAGVIELSPEDLQKQVLNKYHRTLYASAKRGSMWLKTMQRPDGLFTYGWIPSLNRPLPGDNMLRQAGAAVALSRSAAASRDQTMMLSARQAIVALLSTYTEPDPQNPQVRLPKVPHDVNPVGFAGLLLLAISEFPEPTDALLEQGDKVARFIASRQRPDGSLNLSVALEGQEVDVPNGIDYFPGEALYALMRSHGANPQPWKLDVVRKAFPFYQQYWKQNHSMAFVPWQSACMTEAYLFTKERTFADFVFEMNDWLLEAQYGDSNACPQHWVGGFAGRQTDGLVLRTPPGASTGSYAEGLVDACRLAQLLNDADRTVKYQAALRSAFFFLMGTQYSVSESPHFERWFAQRLNGAFYGGVEDGNVRIDYTQHSICAMYHYLNHLTQYVNPDKAKLMPLPTAPKAN